MPLSLRCDLKTAWECGFANDKISTLPSRSRGVINPGYAWCPIPIHIYTARYAAVRRYTCVPHSVALGREISPSVTYGCYAAAYLCCFRGLSFPVYTASLQRKRYHYSY